MIKNFTQFATWFAVASGHPIVFAVACAYGDRVAVNRSLLFVFRLLAVGHKHLDQRRGVSDGIPDPEFAKLR